MKRKSFVVFHPHENVFPTVMPTNRNNNPPSPNGASSDANCLFTSIHYQEWVRILKKSCRKRETVFRFLVNFSMYSFDTACLVFTLITGVVLPGEKTENIAAIALYIFTCAVTVAAEYTRYFFLSSKFLYNANYNYKH